jgi:hypothetical protein
MMEYEKTSYPGDVNILKRPPFEAIPLTVDMLTVSTFNDKGKKIAKAGSPIDGDGKIANTGDAIGILLHDVTEDRPQGAVLKKAYINEEVAEDHSGVTIAAAVKSANPMLVFE